MTAALVSGTTYAALTDILEHLPLNYNADIRRVSETHTSILCSARRSEQLTDIGSTTNDTQQYGFPYINLDGTKMFFTPSCGSKRIVLTADGSTYRNSVPTGFGKTEVRWSHTEADCYYYWSGANLRKYNVVTQVDTIIKTFPSTLQNLGGSVLWMDRNDRYFTVRYGGTVKVWDKQADTTYSGTVPGSNVESNNGYVGITPDGNYVVRSGNGTANGDQLLSYAINHANQSVSTTGVVFWSSGGAHATFVSASNGTNYALVGTALPRPGSTPSISPLIGGT